MSRGRLARTPTAIPAAGWKDVALRVKEEIGKDRIGLTAAGVAFYGILALFPAITAIMAISGLLIEPEQVAEQMQTLSGMIPQDMLDIIISQATEVAGSREGGLGLAAIAGLLIALYSASTGVGSLIQGLNVAYDEQEKRGFIRLKLVTFALTLALIAGLLIGLGVAIAVPAALAFLDFGPTAGLLIAALPWIGLIVLTILGLAVLYRFAPSRDAPKWKWVSVGSVAACLVWVVASAGFAFYVANFASYNESFGALAGAVVLLMWFWISAFIILAGAELNAELEAQTRVDTTRGPGMPMGARGAVKADTLGQGAGG